VFTLDKVVPWGRSFQEYRAMFALADSDLHLKILGCADGPASFNAEATRRGTRVVSCDPIYAFSREQIRERIAATATDILEQTKQNLDEFVWNDITSLEHLQRTRMASMDDFLADFDAGRTDGRYVAAETPSLPFAGTAFDLALCSHFLFLYSAQLDQQAHTETVIELCRVANEVRIFPLVALGGKVSPHLRGVITHLQDAGYGVTIERVSYEFQRGGNEMLRIRRPNRRQD
jgi:hypothetical protein